MYEKAKEWLDGQLGVNVEWMTPKELVRYTRVCSPSGGDSGEGSSDEEGGDDQDSTDKGEKVSTSLNNIMKHSDTSNSPQCPLSSDGLPT